MTDAARIAHKSYCTVYDPGGEVCSCWPEQQREKIAALTAERDELKRKGESLCNWIGVLLTSLHVSTPADGVGAVAALTAHLERYQAILGNPLLLCLAMPEDCRMIAAEAPCQVHARTAGYIAALAQERP